MELTNELYAAESGLSAPVKQQAVRDLTLLLSPFAPHMAEETVARGRRDAFRFLDAAWPQADAALASADSAQVVVQVNGKLRDRIEVPKTLDKDELAERARQSGKIRSLLDGKTLVKTIADTGQTGQFRCPLGLPAPRARASPDRFRLIGTTPAARGCFVSIPR